MSRRRPQSARSVSSRSNYFQAERMRLVPNAVSFNIPDGPVPLLDRMTHIEVDEESEREASWVMSRLHLRFSPQSALSTQTSVVNISVRPAAKVAPKDRSVQADEFVQEEIPTFEQWMGRLRPTPAARSPRPVTARVVRDIHTGRPAKDWKRVILPASPFSKRMIGSKVKDSPTTGAMFSPSHSQRHANHWNFLPTYVLKRHPELFRG